MAIFPHTYWLVKLELLNLLEAGYLFLKFLLAKRMATMPEDIGGTQIPSGSLTTPSNICDSIRILDHAFKHMIWVEAPLIALVNSYATREITAGEESLDPPLPRPFIGQNLSSSSSIGIDPPPEPFIQHVLVLLMSSHPPRHPVLDEGPPDSPPGIDEQEWWYRIRAKGGVIGAHSRNDRRNMLVKVQDVVTNWLLNDASSRDAQTTSNGVEIVEAHGMTLVKNEIISSFRF
ncbi:hypothetical protein C8R42DRAFT_648975 [Lentinula raphanica]|nr:hypothetical protein C8R42DRAFT_648975 [Lentinula raphanica]